MGESALGTNLIAGTSLASVIGTACAAVSVIQSFFADAGLNR
jgi:hypothetical protein